MTHGSEIFYREEQALNQKSENTVKKKSIAERIKEHKVIAALVFILAAIVIVRLIAFAVGSMNPTVAESEAIGVKVMTAEYTDISSTVPLSGRIAPAEETAIVPMASGQVTAVHVKVGDYVKAGTLLFEIDKGQVATTYNQAKAAYDLAANSYNNMKTLYLEGAISKSDFDAAEVQYISARESYNAAAEAYSYYNVTSPIDGYVTSLSVAVGDIAGQQMAASVANTDELKIETTVSEYIAGYIKIGDEVDVYVSTLGDTPYKGTVTAFSPAPALGTLTYPITITLDNESGDLMSGMFAEVKFTAEEADDTICIPSDAVIMKNGKSVAVIIDEDLIPSFREVETGIDNGEFVEILSGIKEGETVVISGQNFVEEGIAVRIIEEDDSQTDESKNEENSADVSAEDDE